MEVNISRGGKKRLIVSVEMQSLNPSDIWHVYLLWFIHICVQISANGEELEWRLESKALKPLTGSEIGGLVVFSMMLMLFSLVKWKTLMPLVCVIGYLYIPYWHLYHTSRITFTLYMYDRTSRLEEGMVVESQARRLVSQRLLFNIWRPWRQFPDAKRQIL